MKILAIGTNRKSLQFLFENHQVTWLHFSENVIEEDIKEHYERLIILKKKNYTAILQVIEPIHLADPFDYIVSFHDNCQEIAYAIAKELGIKCTVDSSIMELTRYKHKLRRHLNQNGIGTVQATLLSNLNIIHESWFPVMIKPIDGTGSRDVYKADSDKMLNTIIDCLNISIDERKYWLVEEFLHGQEYSVEAISIAGKHYILGITKKYVNTDSFLEEGHDFPVRDAETFEQITKLVEQVLTSISLQNGPTHTEIMFTEQGPKIIESHTRYGGDNIPEMVHRVTGNDLYYLSYLSAIDQLYSSEIRFESNGNCSVRYLTCIEHNQHVGQRISAIHMPKQNDKRIIYKKIMLKEGSILIRPTHSFERYAVCMAHTDDESCASLCDNFLNSIQFTFI